MDAPDVLRLAPGLLVRRMHQAHAAAWACHVDPTLTGVEYSMLLGLRTHPRIDQSSLADMIALQRSTAGDVRRRLERRGLVVRGPGRGDRRTHALELTPSGLRVLRTAAERVPALHAALLRAGDDPRRLVRRLEGLADHWDTLATEVRA